MYLYTRRVLKSLQARYTEICMKRKLGTIVLFVLLILTVAAIIKLDHAEARSASLQTVSGGRDGTQ